MTVLVSFAICAILCQLAVGNMVSVIRSLMPPDSPGSLSDQAYTDLAAYLLQVNGSPEGPDELPDDRELLNQILLTESPQD